MENNNNNKKGRGRPKKVKNEEPDSKTTLESSLKQEEYEDDIRLPDQSKVERLVNNNSFEPELYDDNNDLHKVLIESMKEKNNLEEDFLKEYEEEYQDDIRLPDESKVERLVNNNSFEHQDDDDLHKAIIESMKEKNNLEEDFLKESEEEYIFQQFIQQINIEEIEKRSLSLPQFTKRLERLCFSESDRAIKAIIEPIIVEYKLNKRNNIDLESDIFNNIYENFIDTLYQKPISLGKTTTAITKHEDELIRKIFLKKE